MPHIVPAEYRTTHQCLCSEILDTRVHDPRITRVCLLSQRRCARCALACPLEGCSPPCPWPSCPGHGASLSPSGPSSNGLEQRGLAVRTLRTKTSLQSGNIDNLTSSGRFNVYRRSLLLSSTIFISMLSLLLVQMYARR